MSDLPMFQKPFTVRGISWGNTHTKNDLAVKTQVFFEWKHLWEKKKKKKQEISLNIARADNCVSKCKEVNPFLLTKIIGEKKVAKRGKNS